MSRIAAGDPHPRKEESPQPIGEAVAAFVDKHA
jgi:hypothetical protein